MTRAGQQVAYQNFGSSEIISAPDETVISGYATYSVPGQGGCYHGWVWGIDSLTQDNYGVYTTSECYPGSGKCYLDVYASFGGHVSWSNNVSDYYNCGAQVSLYAWSILDYDFCDWTGTYDSTDNPFAFTLLEDPTTETAYFTYNPPPPPCFDPDPSKCTSPIVFNLGRGDYDLSSTKDPVTFDLNADGMPERTSWTSAGAHMAFLALDRNGDGNITDGSELFGNHTPLQVGGVAANGFIALAQYDDNHDLVIDARDAIWNRLLLWTDLNHDGISQPNELQPVSQSAVTAIELRYHWTGRTDQNGNVFGFESRVHLGKDVRACYDIYFRSAP